MKKNTRKETTTRKMEQLSKEERAAVTTVGIDLGDRSSQYAAVDSSGEIVAEGRIGMSAKRVMWLVAMLLGGTRIVIEVGMHSPWVSRLLNSMGMDVLVVNPAKLRLISHNERKCDRTDAEILAVLGQSAPHLLHPVVHRSEQAQLDRTMLLARDVLVRSRARLISMVRGVVKAQGGRISSCSAEAFATRAHKEMPEALHESLDGVVAQIGELTRKIRAYDVKLEQVASRYPATAALRAIKGVGPVTALAFVLCIDDASRFRKSRDLGPFFGLVPRQRSSSQSNPQLRITKAGDRMVRRLLVGCAQYMLGPFGEPCDLRTFGLRHAELGGKNAKRRAVVAVARKLAVMMHAIWISGTAYDPHFRSRGLEPSPSAAA